MRMKSALGKFARLAYPDRMAIARRDPGDRIPPAPRPHNLERYESQWIAVLEGKVIAQASSSGDLAAELKKVGPMGQDAVMQYVRPPVAGYVIGVG
jgi:hypothetical protein